MLTAIISHFDRQLLWNKHGKEEQPQRENSLDEIMQDPEFNILFDDFDDFGSDDEDVSGGYSSGLGGGHRY